MAVGWNGADPSEVADAADYELGTAYKANVDITLTHVRVWSGAGELNLSGRTGTIWSTAGGVIGSIALPTDLPPGWSSYALGTPIPRTSGQQWIVSFGTGGNYPFLSHGLDADVVSSDGAVSALGFAAAPSGINGRFASNPGDFPNTGNASHAFYGADVQYTIGIGGNTPPRIDSASVSVSAAVATVQIQASDDETLIGASYRVDWGDGSGPSVVTYPVTILQHTYAASGTYALLLSVTDASGSTIYAARAAVIRLDPSSPGQFPYVKMPSATKMLVTLLSAHAQLPPELEGKVVAELQDNFPSSLPWLKVAAVPGASSRPVVQRVGQTAFDLHIFAFRNDVAEDYARTVAGIAQSLVGKATDEGGIVNVDVTEPFPLPDQTTAHRWIVQVTLTYRPI